MLKKLKKMMCLSLLVMGLCVPMSVPAQVSSATVSGAVTDETGAKLPNATVTAKAVATGVVTKVESNASGEYTLPLLKPGTYDLTVEAKGFRRYEQKSLPLSAGDHPIVDFPMQVGGSEQTVEVTATTPLLGTADASLGQIVPAKLVEDLPLNGRTPMSFAQYTVGVIATTNPVGVHAYDNSAVSAFSVGGLPNKNAEILMDGSPDNASDNAIAYSPPVDATSEVRIQVFESDASYGHSGGAVANQITKSGTNRLHGTLSEFNQVSALNANPYFSNRVAGFKKSVYRYNQYGGTIGGPVWIPKVYNGRDKVFFFFGYEGIRNVFPQNGFITVPTLAERNGDFSALLAQGTPRSTDVECRVNGVNVLAPTYNSNAIFDPATAKMSTVCPGVIERQAFPNNVITRALNPVAVAALQYFPQPNVPGNALGQNNYYSTTNGRDKYDNQIGRFDFNLSQRHRVYVTGRHSERDQIIGQVFGASNPALGDTLQRVNLGGSVGDIITLSPTLVAEVRLNYTRFEQNSATNGDGFDATTVGLPKLQTNHPIFPRFFFNTQASLGSTSMTPGVAPFNSYNIFGDVLKTIGVHSLKFGVDGRRFQKGQFNFGDSSGRYSFDNAYTKNFSTNTFTPPAGYDTAAFLLGLPSSGSYDLNAHAVGNQSYFGLFVQDDWRVRPDFVINAGLRYDKDFSPYERSGAAVSGFDPTTANPISAAAKAAYAKAPVAQLPAGSFNVNGGLTFADKSGQFSNFTSHMFSPRVGFSYSPKELGGSSVIRGGFGIFVIPIFPFNNAINQSGYSQTTQSPSTLNGYLTPNATLSNPFPNGLVQPSGSSNGLSTFLGQSLTVLSPTIRNGYSERWHLGYQRQLPGNWLAEAFYVGSTGRRLPINQSLNYIQPQFLTTASNPALSANTTNPFAGLIPNGGSLNGGTVSIAQLLQTYPEFGAITIQNAPNGSSIYHALDVHVEHRAGHGISLIANYQWSKLLEAVSYLNAFDARPEYRISSFDRPHHAVIALSYALPYGRGRQYGARVPFWVDLPLGGWNIASSYFFQSGAPIGLGNVIRNAGVPLNYNPREATEAGNANTTTPSFNLAAFGRGAQPVNNIRTFGSQFSNFRVDPYNDWDASILKNFNFTEGSFFQFRLESFNVNNRPVFAGPNVSPTSSAFGQILGTANSPRTMQLGGRIVF